VNTPDIIAIRASSLSDLFDCAARWEAKHIRGMRMPTNGKATLGKAVHASTAVYDQSTIDGAGVTVDEAAAAAVDAIHHPDEEVIWEDDGPSDAEKIALSLHSKYCTTVAPKQIYRAVEVACDSLVISDLGIALTGTTDRVRETDEGFGIADLKTGKQAVSADGIAKTSGFAFQIGVYELLAEAASGLKITAPGQIIGMNTAKTAASQRVGTGDIHGARDVLLGDDESPGVLQIASRIIHSGVFPGNPRSMLCSATYCPAFATCKFRR
jgi:hypothetical protein